MANTLGIIGCGKMGGALLKGILTRGLFTARDVSIFDVSRTRLDEVSSLGVNVGNDNSSLISASDVVILAVKPQSMKELLKEIVTATNNKLVISIAAGVSIPFFESQFSDTTRIIRAMPNTPAMIGEGVTAIARGSKATDEDVALAQVIFEAVGKVVVVEEGLMDAVTGLSGSGPAYAFLMIDALADGGVLMGIPKDLALKMAAQTMLGAAKLFLEEDKSPGEFKDMVTSPGGTTAAGLHALEKGSFRSLLISAVQAATLRSAELGKK